METPTTLITETHETFFARITPLFPPSEELKIRLAYVLAKAGHRNQFRKEIDKDGNQGRYFEHPRRVALILIDELEITDWEMIATAFLHDGLEDIRGLTPEMLESYFGTNVCRMVKLLTKDPKEGYWQRLAKRGDFKTIIVKSCDRLDNLRSLGQTTEEFQQKQIQETKDYFYTLLAAHGASGGFIQGGKKNSAQYLLDQIRDIVKIYSKK